MKKELFVGICCLFCHLHLGRRLRWLEGENPTTQNLNVGGAGGENPQFLSRETWLSVNLEAAQVEKQCPPEGILLGYDFEPPAADHYEVWNRIGFEFVRSPFDWRMDQGEWQTIQPEDLTTDLMEIGFLVRSGLDQDGGGGPDPRETHRANPPPAPLQRGKRPANPPKNPLLFRCAVPLSGGFPPQRQA